MPLTLAIGFAVACLMNRHIRGISLLRALFFLPVVSSPTAVGLLWSWIFAQDQGVLNSFVTALGGNPVNWLGPKVILYSVVIDHSLRVDALIGIFRRLERNDFGINSGFAYAACNQLRDLAAKVDDKDSVRMCRGAHAEHLDKKQPKCNGRSATFQQ